MCLAGFQGLSALERCGVASASEAPVGISYPEALKHHHLINDDDLIDDDQGADLPAVDEDVGAGVEDEGEVGH